MTYKEDFTLDKKYLNILGKHIYDKEHDKFGRISSIEICDGIGIMFKVYYDKFNSDNIVFFNDFKEGKVQFVIIIGLCIGKELEEKSNERTIEDIKCSMGEDFREDMLLYIDEEDRKEKNWQNDEREIQSIGTKNINVKRLSAEVFYDDFTCKEAYKKYAEGYISETEMLYIICNHLCEEQKRLKNENLEYFINKMNMEEAELLVDYASRKAGVDAKNNKITSDEDKEKIIQIMDILLDGFKEKYEETVNGDDRGDC